MINRRLNVLSQTQRQRRLTQQFYALHQRKGETPTTQKVVSKVVK